MPKVINARNREGIIVVFQKRKKLPNGEEVKFHLNEERAPVVEFSDRTMVSYTWDDILALAIEEKAYAEE